MESIKQTLRGLLLGFGFSVGALLIYVAYQLYVAAPANIEFRRSLIKEIETDFEQLSAIVLDYKLMKETNVVLVASKIHNIGTRGQLDVAPKIDFFDQDGEFLFDCYGKTVPFVKGGTEAYFTTECRSLDESKAKRISDVRARPVSRT
jgi:hypothetical protein